MPGRRRIAVTFRENKVDELADKFAEVKRIDVAFKGLANAVTSLEKQRVPRATIWRVLQLAADQYKAGASPQAITDLVALAEVEANPAHRDLVAEVLSKRPSDELTYKRATLRTRLSNARRLRKAMAGAPVEIATTDDPLLEVWTMLRMRSRRRRR